MGNAVVFVAVTERSTNHTKRHKTFREISCDFVDRLSLLHCLNQSRQSIFRVAVKHSRHILEEQGILKT